MGKKTVGVPKAKPKQEPTKRKRVAKSKETDTIPVLSPASKAKYQKQWETMLDTGIHCSDLL